jgi:hypothetical protein
MHDAGRVIRWIVDGVEDVVENALKGREKEPEHRPYREPRVTLPPQAPVTVNVHVECGCCPPQSKPPSTAPGTRPPHVT